MTATAVRTRSLVKTFGRFGSPTWAVDALSLSVPAASIYGLLRRNSAGKTTTIRMLMWLVRPTSGFVEVLGLNLGYERERVAMLRQVGYVPEDKALLGMSTRQLFELNRAFYPETWSDDPARKAVDRLELPLDTTFIKLSLGNKTKAARRCHRPALTVADSRRADHWP